MILRVLKARKKNEVASKNHRVTNINCVKWRLNKIFPNTTPSILRFIVPEMSNKVLRLDITAVLSASKEETEELHFSILNNINKLNVAEICSAVSQSEVVIKLQINF